MRISRKRLLLGAGGITAVGAVATLVLGTTLGLFSATTPAATSNPAFTAGKVSLDQTKTFTCTFTVSNSDTNGGNIAAGDKSTNFGAAGGVGSPCSIGVSYTGTLGAYVGLDVTYTSTPAASVPTPYPATPAPSPRGLYDPTDGANTLEIQVWDANGGGEAVLKGDSTSGTVYDTIADGAASQLGSTGVKDLLLEGASALTFAPGDADTLYVDWKLPSTAGNAYQGSTVTLTFVVHAVQAANNTAHSNTGPTACERDDQCLADATAPAFSWS